MSNILEDSYWVIENKILGVRKPKNFEELQELSGINMGGIISLLDNEENLELYKDCGVRFKWTPVKGGSAPSKEQVAQALSFAKEVWHDSKVLVVHCSGGKKRTATMIASILKEDGLSSKEAIGLIRKANPDIVLNDGQLDFIKSF